MGDIANLMLTDDEIDFDEYLTDIPEAAKGYFDRQEWGFACQSYFF